MIQKGSKKLSLTKTELYMAILMLNSIIDEFYDELSQVSYDDMYKLMDSENAFSFFEKYKENGAVHSLMYLYEGTPKIAEFNYLMADMLCISYPRKCSIEFKGVSLLLAACMELYVHYETHELSYNGETKQQYYWRELFQDFSIVCKNLVELLRAEFLRLFKIKLHHQ